MLVRFMKTAFNLLYDGGLFISMNISSNIPLRMYNEAELSEELDKN
jgi:ABC-type transporter Mla maintaining outer membrane lipid asymmetry ATPase subunit MlaF